MTTILKKLIVSFNCTKNAKVNTCLRKCEFKTNFSTLMIPLIRVIHRQQYQQHRQLSRKRINRRMAWLRLQEREGRGEKNGIGLGEKNRRNKRKKRRVKNKAEERTLARYTLEVGKKAAVRREKIYRGYGGR